MDGDLGEYPVVVIECSCRTHCIITPAVSYDKERANEYLSMLNTQHLLLRGTGK